MKAQVLLCDMCKQQINAATGWSMQEQRDTGGRLQLQIYRLTAEAPIHLCGHTCVQRRVADFLQRPDTKP